MIFPQRAGHYNFTLASPHPLCRQTDITLNTSAKKSQLPTQFKEKSMIKYLMLDNSFQLSI